MCTCVFVRACVRVLHDVRSMVDIWGACLIFMILSLSLARVLRADGDAIAFHFGSPINDDAGELFGRGWGPARRVYQGRRHTSHY